MDYIRNYRFPPEKEDYSIPLPPRPEAMEVDSASEERPVTLPIITDLGLSNARIMPPPMFSRQAIQFNYKYETSYRRVSHGF